MTTTAPTRILLIDDHPAVTNGLRVLLSQDNHTICGEAINVCEAQDFLASTQPDLILLDLSLGEDSGLGLLAETQRRGLPALIYSMHEDAQTISLALERGATGYVSKRDTSEALLLGVRQALSGERFLSPRAEASLERARQEAGGEGQPLSERERQVLQCLARGDTTAEIGESLGVSPKTVESYYQRMMNKLAISGLRALRKHAHRFPQGV